MRSLLALRVFVFASVLAIAGGAFAQWNPPTGGGPITYNGGNVGIGTTSPSVLLHLAGQTPYLALDRVSTTYESAVSFRTANSIWSQWLIGNAPGADENLTIGWRDFTAANRRFVLTANGFAGFGRSNPTSALHVLRGSTLVGAHQLELEGAQGGWGAGIRFSSTTAAGGTPLEMARITADGESSWNTVVDTQRAGLRFWVTSAGVSSERMRLTNTGSLGLGTPTPTALLHLYDPLAVVGSTQVQIESRMNGYGAGIRFTSLTADPNAGGTRPEMAKIVADGAAPWNTDPTTQDAMLRIFTTENGASLERVRVAASGNVGIGTTNPTHTLHVNGSIYATSVIGAVYQDVAEWVPATEDLAPGTVVVLSTRDNNLVTASKDAYDHRVAGVVSPQPGLILGEGGSNKEMIATTGRVKVRVDATKHAIAIGDLLVTSTKSGTAMRSEAVEINGRQFHQPGTILGKALEPLAGGTGEILVLLSLQ
jgi:hypothetical protein